LNPERTIGESLRQARESRGQSQEDVSRVTRISLAVIRKLELDRFSELPGNLYTENFIRILADHLELDGNSLLTRYREGQQADAIAETQPAVVKATAKTKSKPKGESGKRKKKDEHVTHVWHEETIQETRVRGWRLPWRLWIGLGSLVLVAAVVLLVSLGYLNLHWGRQGVAQDEDSRESTTPAPPPAGNILRAESGAPGSAMLPETVTAPAEADGSPQGLDGQEERESPAAARQETGFASDPRGRAPLIADAAGAGASAAALPDPARLRLEIVATAASRVQLNVDDRRHLTRRFSAAGGHWTVEGEEFFIFSAADAEHLKLSLNGEDYALPSAEAGRIMALRLDGSTPTPEP